ncbi:hypothetical protein GCM10022200_17110 [Microbacterium awajiense]|uniref:Potassium channel domain-containing protein n=1 Tax=Microbacterium awajiense TaxID=415214 RepID=A0ABP7AK65_9MICO
MGVEALWITLGVVILAITALDTFLAVINYNEVGLVVNRVARVQWLAMRAITRSLPRRFRPLALRQVTGIITITIILTWLAGIIFGFSLIYFGAMSTGAISRADGAPEGYWAALYLSIGQFSTVGVETVTAVNPVIAVLAVLQALTSVVMLSMIVTFLLNVFNGIQMLRSLCADVSVPAGIDDPVAVLYPFFPHGQMRDLERYLTVTWGDMNLYGDVLRQTRVTYYFQSGEDTFASPFALSSIGSIVAGLRWGLPTASGIPTLPGLLRLEESLAAARRWISAEILHLEPLAPPIPVERGAFAEAMRALHSEEGPGAIVDPWVAEFDTMCRAMARLTSADRSDDAALTADDDEAYHRYVEWLPFAVTTRRFNNALSADLDYQPLYVGASPPLLDAAGVPVALPPGDAPAPPRTRQSWSQRRLVAADPGGQTRRTVGVLAGALVAIVGVGLAAGLPAAGIVVAAGTTVLSVIDPGLAMTRRPWWTVVGAIPAAAAVFLAAVTPGDPLWSAVGIAVVVAVTIAAQVIGHAPAVVGRQVAAAYLLALFAGVAVEEAPWTAVAVAAAVASAVSVTAALRSRDPHRLLGQTVRSIRSRVDDVLVAAADAVDARFADRRQHRALKHRVRALRRTAALGLDRLVASADAAGAPPLAWREIESVTVQVCAEADRVARASVSDGLAKLNPAARAVVSARLDSVRDGRSPGVADRAEDAVQAALLGDLADLSASLRDLVEVGDAPASAPSRMLDGEPPRAAGLRRAAQAGIAVLAATGVAGAVAGSPQPWPAAPSAHLVHGPGVESRGRLLVRAVWSALGAASGLLLGTVAATHTISLVVIALAGLCLALVHGRSAAVESFAVNALFATVYAGSGAFLLPDWWIMFGLLVGTIVLSNAIALGVLPLTLRRDERDSAAARLSEIGRTVKASLGGRRMPALDGESDGATGPMPIAPAWLGVQPVATAPLLRPELRYLESAADELADSVPGASHELGDAGLRRRAAEITEVNVAAAVTACRDRLPRHIVGLETVSELAMPSAGASNPTIIQLRRLNAGLQGLVDTVRTGS